MKKDAAGVVPAAEKPGILKTMLLCLPMIIITLLMLTAGKPPTEPAAHIRLPGDFCLR